MIAKARPRQYCGVPGCGKSFDRPAKLVAHQRTHSGEKPFQCPTCSRPFAQKKHLKVHELRHLEPQLRPFVCKVCGKGHISKQHYERHMKTHEAVKKLECQHCHRTFIQRKSFEKHVSRHISCQNCHVVCNNNKELSAHMSKYHSGRYHCSECTERFDSLQDVRSHNKLAHGPIKQLAPAISFIVGLDYKKRTFGCPFECGKRFQRHYDLERHMSTSHGKEP